MFLGLSFPICQREDSYPFSCLGESSGEEMGESGELHPRSPLRPLSAWDSAISLPALWGKHHPLLVPSSPSNSGGDQTPLHALPILPGGSVVKNLPAGDTGDPGSIPGSGRSPGGGNGNPRQYSCLEDPMGRGAWPAHVHARQALPRPRHHRELRGVLESRTQLEKPLKRW